jgi:hypothetical protein
MLALIRHQLQRKLSSLRIIFLPFRSSEGCLIETPEARKKETSRTHLQNSYQTRDLENQTKLSPVFRQVFVIKLVKDQVGSLDLNFLPLSDDARVREDRARDRGEFPQP